MPPWLGKRAHGTLPEVVVKLCKKMSIKTPIFYYPVIATFGGDTSPSSQQAGIFCYCGNPTYWLYE